MLGVEWRPFRVFFLVSWIGVRLSKLGTSATNWPIVPAPDDRRFMWSSRCNENWQEKPKYSEKTCPSANLSTTNPTWPEPGLNPGSHGGKPELWHGRSEDLVSSLTSWLRYLIVVLLKYDVIRIFHVTDYSDIKSIYSTSQGMSQLA
jgi:hypothetical protein